MLMDSKCAITMPLPELAFEWMDVTPAIEGAKAANERARFARARLKADAERLLLRQSAERDPPSEEGSPLGDTGRAAPVVRLLEAVGVDVSDVPVTAAPPRK